MFEPTERDVDKTVESSMELFKRAKVGKVAPMEPKRPEKILLALDGSAQDRWGLALARRLRKRFDCAVSVVDAREKADADLAPEAASSIDGEALPRGSGDNFEQILAAVEASGCDLVIVPCPFGRELEKVGPDSTGTVIDVLLARSPVPLLVVRGEVPEAADVFSEVLFVLWGENEGAPAAARWAAGLVEPQGTLQLVLILETEFYENLRAVMRTLAPEVEVNVEKLSNALAQTHVRLHAGLQQAASEAGFSYDLRIEQEAGRKSLTHGEGATCLVVVALEREDHSSQGHVANRIRHASSPVLVVARG